MTDLLDRAVDAYRPSGAVSDPAETRARVLRSIRARDRRHRAAWIGGLVALLALTNSTTWAWSTGAIDRTWAKVEAAIERPAEEPRVARRERPVREREAAIVERVDVPASDPIAIAPTERTPAELAPSGSLGRSLDRPRAIDRAPVTNETQSDGTPEESPLDRGDRLAFEEAHRAHFGGGASTPALLAWEDYLRRFPDGRFVPEATFNRAICLVRLGRREQARAALEAIAQSDHPRRADAMRLLQSLTR